MNDLFSRAPSWALRGSNWKKIFLALTAVLGSTILLKVGSIQYLELIYFVLIVVQVFLFVDNDYRAKLFRPLFWIASAYTLFCITAFALAVASLRYDFYFPIYLEYLKRPVYITASRIAELAASVTALVYMTHLFRFDLASARFTMRIYFWTGVISGLYSLISLPLNIAGIDNLGAYNLYRLRGFYNEGGPYGLYVLSVFLVGVALERQHWEPRRRVLLALAVMVVVLLGCYSKAAIFAVLTIIALNGLFASSLKLRVIIITAGIGLLFTLTYFFDLRSFIKGYQETAAQYERLSRLRPEDVNFVYGRVAGAFLVPRMIAAHPLTGIGWGNYGILRNAPEYRGAAQFVEYADDPGLGIFGAAAELGLPLLAFLLVCLFLPYIYLRSLRAPAYITNLALLQPIVHIFGAQLNLTYPWIVTSFAMGLGYGLHRLGGVENHKQIPIISVALPPKSPFDEPSLIFSEIDSAQ